MDEIVYCAPTNFKGGRLIFGTYHIIDLVILAVGTLMMIVGCLICFNNLSGLSLKIGVFIFVLIGCISWFFTTSYSVYHNIFGYILECCDYITSEKEYIWGGIIQYEEEDTKKEGKKFTKKG